MASGRSKLRSFRAAKRPAVREEAASALGPTAIRVLPTFGLVAAAWALAWIETGSIDAADWLPYALLAGLLLAVVLLAGDAARLRQTELVAIAALLALAGWDAISLTWSAAPDLARDEALLTAFYAIVFVVPLLTLRTARDRLAVVGVVAAGAGALAVGSALTVRFGANQADKFLAGRLSFPISYWNALAAVFLVGFWPAIVLAARRESSPFVRALAVGAATATASGWLAAQSKGGAVAIAVSAALLLALSPLRLRLLGPVLIAAGATAAASEPLTKPYRVHGAVFVDAVRHAGAALLVATAAALAAGLLFALVDRRLTLGPRAVRMIGLAVLVATCAAAAAAIALFFGRVEHPIGLVQSKWHHFKSPARETASTHLFSLGSARYDIWRVGLDDFEHHPLAGIGSRGFRASYLEHRRVADIPARAHSLELDALSETGVIGFVLLAVALAIPFVPLVLRILAAEPAATAAFGGSVYWFVHASADWLWTVPACGIPFFILLGLGSAGGERLPLSRRSALAAAAVVVLILAVAFVPPWLSTRLTDRAFSVASPAGDIRWAKRLDPLSVAPYRAQAARARSPRAAAAALAEAVRKEPRSTDLRYELGLAYARAREWRRAKAALLAARRLDPREVLVTEALRRLPHGR